MQDTTEHPLSVPALEPGTDTLTAALAYARAGWYVLPVKRGTKHPGSVVGGHWQDKSSRDPKVITAWFAGTDHGIALHCGRSGAVVFDVDRSESVPDALAAALKDEGVPYQSSRPDQPRRGHYMFRMPDDRLIGNPTFAGGEVRGLNGVIIVQPSTHPEGGEYRWQRTGAVPVLPDAIAEQLPEGKPGEDAATDAQVAEFLAEHTTGSSGGWLGPLRNLQRAINTLVLINGERLGAESRHDSTLTMLVWAMDEAAAGCYPAKPAVAAIKDAFLQSVTRKRKPDDRLLSDAEARSEFHGILAWSVGQAKSKTAQQLSDIRGKFDGNWMDRAGQIDIEVDELAIETTESTLGDEDFWQARESLRCIYTTALSRMCSPWAVLAHCAARALAVVPPNVVLPPIIGYGSLNWFAAVAALSAEGKSAAEDVAFDLVRHNVITRNLGSGEGIVDQYIDRDGCGKATGGWRQSVMFVADEIDTMAALRSRSGSTLMSILRSGFSGKALGFSYVKSNGAHLRARTYRMTMVVNVQPALAGWLLGDHHGGTPQRFQWFPAADHRVSDDPPWPEGDLKLPNPSEWQYPREIAIPDEARKLIVSEAVKRNRGETDALDGHRLFVWEKFAYALAVLDGRVEMSSEDWSLAGEAMRVSDLTRERVRQAVERATEDDAVERGRLAGISNDAAADEREFRHRKRLNRIADLIVRHLKDTGPQGLTEGALKQMQPGRDRRLVGHVLSELAKLGRVTRDGKRWSLP